MTWESLRKKGKFKISVISIKDVAALPFTGILNDRATGKVALVR